MLQTPLSIMQALDRFDSVPYDRESIPQQQLDLANRLRTSLFPWHGQFSPELVELLLRRYAVQGSRATVVHDPFVGSGTTLFECARQGLTCYAAEINPAAVLMSSTAHFVNVPRTEREACIRCAEAIARTHIEPLVYDLFTYQSHATPPSYRAGPSMEETLASMLQEATVDPLVYNLLANAVLRYVGREHKDGVQEFQRAFREHVIIVETLPYSDRPCRVYHADAREIPLPDASVDLIITSPPYINVFNYHQNSRPAMEMMGWDMLHVARSEIGSNRKNRQNRFLTVVQYALDMLGVLRGMRRLLRPFGRAVIIVGRESRVRGVSFENGRLVAALATGGAGFSLISKQERKFRSKFGEIIYEDILHLVPEAAGVCQSEGYARSVAELVLSEAATTAVGPVRGEILDAAGRVGFVEKSPLFRLPEGRTVLGAVRSSTGRLRALGGDAGCGLSNTTP